MSDALEQASLIMVPSGYENGTLGSLKPLDGTGDFTFSRGSDISATRVNEDGYIEKGYENLLLQSNTFSNSSWVKGNTSVTSGQTGYDGTSDAWLLEATSNGYNRRVYQDISISGVLTYSFYAKANTSNYAQAFIFNSSGADPTAYFNLSTGLVETNTNAVDVNMVDAGDGWYRCSITGNAAISQVRLFVSDFGFMNLVDAGGSIYIQDAMLNQGMVSYPYVETTTAPVAGGILEDMPRLDYSGSCPALLLEPQRTNLLEYSEYFGDWNTINCSVDFTTSLNPEGKQGLYELIEDSTNSTRILRSSNYISFIGGTSYTMTAFFKANTRSKVRIVFGGAGLGFPSIDYRRAEFDLSNGSVLYTPINGDASIEFIGNGWYRCTNTITPISSANAYFDINLLDDSGNITYQGDGTSGFYVYGAQIEQDATYPTSYIPTYGTSQTRLAESCVVNGATSSIGQTEGTMFLDFVYEANGGGFYGSYVANATGFSDFVGWRVQDNKTTLDILIRYNNAYQVIANVPSLFAVGNRYKVALKYSSGDIKAFVNNQEKFSSTATYTTPSVPLSKHTISGAVVNLVDSFQADTISKVNQSILFPTALSDDECIALTTIS